MIKWLVFFGISVWTLAGFAQVLPVQAEVEADIRFLADDALMGRAVGTPGHDVASLYIETQYRLAGVKPVPGQTSYRQSVGFERQIPAKSGLLRWGDMTWQHGDRMIWRAGEAAEVEAEVVFVGYGEVDSAAEIDDLAGKSLKGKIVISYLGTRNARDLTAIAQASREKRARFQEMGAVALLEIYKLNIPWNYVKTFLLREQVRLQEGNNPQTDQPLLYGWMEDTEEGWATLLEKNKQSMYLQTAGTKSDVFQADNMVGWIQGYDTAVSDEYLIISAHYDHVGVSASTEGAAKDTIFNGARDNAIGTSGLLAAARHFAAHPPRRSLLFLAVTAEEKGLLGSQYYVENPLLPLDKAIFDLNTDGAGYNDTTAVSVIGYGRVGVDKDLELVAQKYDFRVIPNPSPEQGLFDRSDNASFAQKGIPCVNYSPGMTTLDAEIMKNYHQVTDEAEGLEFGYLTRFVQAFVETARLIADRDTVPFWVAGDKYEAVGKGLYGRE